MEVISIILMAVGILGAIATSHLTGALLFAKWENITRKRKRKMRGEIWKIIDGYSLYEVSNMGRVKVRGRKIITCGEKRSCSKTIKEKS